MITMKTANICSITRHLSSTKERLQYFADRVLGRTFDGRRLLSDKATRVKTSPKSCLSKQLQARIRATGPITVSDYMKEVLTNPATGYYMHKDVFGHGGDFITSPEISPLFGEMIAVWLLTEWRKMGSPRPCQLIELGPGRGTLMADILKVFRQFETLDGISIHLVEVSPHLCDLQAKTLGVVDKNVDVRQLHHRSGITGQGLPIDWYSRIEDVPTGFSTVLAHEFFDALPIHKFQKTDAGWREILIDLDVESGADKFRFVLSRYDTPASVAYVRPGETREHVEISPQSLVIVQHLASRLEEHGGFALLADYGHDGTKTDTFRAFRRHSLHDPLQDPGSADLTADVDFSALRAAAQDKLLAFGPVAQRDFLCRMGIDVRLENLLAGCDTTQRQQLRSGYHMIMDDDSMGQRFKFFSLFPEVLKDHLTKFPVVGFS